MLSRVKSKQAAPRGSRLLTDQKGVSAGSLSAIDELPFHFR